MMNSADTGDARYPKIGDAAGAARQRTLASVSSTQGSAMATASLDQDLAAVFASDPRALADPFPVWSRLREAAPVYPLGDLALVGRHADVSALLRDPRLLSNTKGRGSQSHQSTIHCIFTAF